MTATTKRKAQAMAAKEKHVVLTGPMQGSRTTLDAFVLAIVARVGLWRNTRTDDALLAVGSKKA